MNHNTINSILTKSGGVNSAIIRRKDFKLTNIYITVTNATAFMPDDTPFSHRVSLYRDNIHSIPICIQCGNSVKYNNNTKKFNKCCSNKCARQNAKNTGVIWNTSSGQKKEIRDKKNQFKHIIENNSYVPASRDECISFIDDRIKYTNYGRLHAWVNSKILLQYSDILATIISSIDIDDIDLLNIPWSECLYLYYNNKTQSKCICGKACRYISFTSGYQSSCSNKCSQYIHMSEVKANIESLGYQIIGVTPKMLMNNKFALTCSNCNHTFERYLTNGRWKQFSCLNCLEHNTSSIAETEIAEFIRNHINTEIVTNTRKVIPPHEIDIYLPEYKLAIEYNGMYWHSHEVLKNKKYHVLKTNKCNDRSVQLLHVFECEWQHKQDIVKSIILSKLGKLPRRISARKCTIDIISANEKNIFLTNNHIQGKDKSSIKLGLRYNGELVCIATFGKRLITRKQPTWELIRFCNILNTSVIGGFSRLLALFEQEYLLPGEVLHTYADRRYSTGQLYYQNKFILSHISIPGYWYIPSTCNTILHRSLFQKHKLKTRIDTFDNSKTEYQNMIDNNYLTIWDSGQYVFTKKKPV